jgi:UDP-N-acetylglucosamine 2-epimerase (non-hydrolysing)
VPCLTLRASTERPVTVDLGTNTVIGDEPANARALVEDILRRRYKKGGPIPGWDGAAAPRVVEALMSRLGDSETR